MATCLSEIAFSNRKLHIVHNVVDYMWKCPCCSYF